MVAGPRGATGRLVEVDQAAPQTAVFQVDIKYVEAESTLTFMGYII
jgi:hypothetical protein